MRGTAGPCLPPGDGKVTIAEFIRLVIDQTATDSANTPGKSQTPYPRNEGDGDWVLSTPAAPAGGGGGAAGSLAEAQRLLRAGEFALARAAFTRSLAASPRQARAYHGRGLAAMALDDAPAALADFQEAVAVDPKDAQAWISLGGALGRAGKAPEARDAYDRALRLDPKAAAAYIGRGAARLELNQIDGALADLNRALQLNARSADALFYRSRLHALRGDPAAARADTERLKALDQP